MRSALFPLFLLPVLAAAQATEPTRLVLLGDGFIERAQQGGVLEGVLQRAAEEDQVIHLTNLGWSGDTVFSHARSNHPDPRDGVAKLKAQLEEIRPHRAILCYGAQLAFEGDAELAQFKAGYPVLLDLVRKASPGVEIHLASPPQLESIGRGFPDHEQTNARLRTVVTTIREIAEAEGCGFVDLFHGLARANPPVRYTTDGVQYNSAGYHAAGIAFARALLKVETPPQGLGSPELLAAIEEKDRLSFRRWRPSNITYLYGFRKHEQGQNAAEIPQFDPLIAEAQKAIQKARETSNP